MTQLGGSDDAARDALGAMQMRVEGDEAAYRQDDAPPSSPSDHPNSAEAGSGPAGEPSRDVGQVLATLSSTPKEFARLIDGQSEEALAQPASDGEWGVVEILPHLRDWEAVYLGWIRQTLNEETPQLVDVDDTLWAIEHDYASEHVPDALNQFGELRSQVVHTLEALEDGDWRREAVHPRVGRLTLHQLADRMCDHDARHIEQARDALA
jgi:hypothetical protein